MSSFFIGSTPLMTPERVLEFIPLLFLHKDGSNALEVLFSG
jgi:hypothetical protein